LAARVANGLLSVPDHNGTYAALLLDAWVSVLQLLLSVVEVRGFEPLAPTLRT
jgi:hypothetical protein